VRSIYRFSGFCSTGFIGLAVGTEHLYAGLELEFDTTWKLSSAGQDFFKKNYVIGKSIICTSVKNRRFLQ